MEVLTVKTRSYGRAPSALGGLALLLALIFSTHCARTSEEDQLRALVESARAAAGERDTGGVVGVLSDDFCATPRRAGGSAGPCRGLGREDVRRMVLAKLLPRGWVRVWTRGVKVKMTGPSSARVEVLAIMARGEPVKGLEDLVPGNAEVMRFELEAQKRDGAWTFVRGQAERLTLQGLEALSHD